MKYKIKRITMDEPTKNDEVELPNGAIIIKAESSRAIEPFAPTSTKFRQIIERWTITYLEPIKKEKK